MSPIAAITTTNKNPHNSPQINIITITITILLALNSLIYTNTLAFQITDQGSIYNSNNDTQALSKPVTFSVHPKNVTALDRKAVFLTCEAEADPKPTFTWFKDGIKISARRLPTIKYSKGTVLTIDPIKSGRDEGEYECQIENGYAPTVRSQIQVRIVSSAEVPPGFPKIITQPQSQTVQVGDVATVNCLAQGDPLPEYSWFHDSVPVELPDPTGKRVIDHGSLKINNVTEDDKGTYHCMVINSKGVETSSASNLMVSREPLPENPPIDLRYFLTSPADVTITWSPPETKNNATISGYQVDFGKSGVLPKKIDLPRIERIAFNDLSENTEYAVRVRAKLLSGRLGTYSEAIRFTTPKDSPPPPSNVKALADSYSSAMVWWDEAAYFSGIIGYRVYYTLYSDSVNSSTYLEGLDRWLVKNVTMTNSVIISNLIENAQYEVRVCAVGVNFSGKLSNPVKFNTSPDEVPRDLQATQLTTHSVKLIWKPPLELAPVRYKITYDAPEKTYFNEKMVRQTISLSPRTLNTTATSINLDDLMPYTKYRINVTAVPSKEAFRPPAIVHITTAMAAPKRMNEPSTCNPINTRECEIFLSLASEEFSPIGHYYVVVVPGEMPTNDPDNYVTGELIDRSKRLGDGVYIAAKFHKHKMPFKFVLGDNRSYDGFLNRPLDPDHQYRVFTRAYVEHSDTLYSNSDMSPPFSLSLQSKQVVQPLNNESFKNVRTVLMSALALVLALALIVTIFYKKQRQALKTNQINETTIRLLPEHMMDRIYSTVPIEPVERRLNNYQSRATNKHQPVLVSDLADHIEVLKIGNNLKEEYESIEPGQQFTWEHSNMDCNRPKNRYGNVVSYDHNRVVLNEIDGIPGSGYINANFCDGYNRPNQYIATQGPLPNTVGDFWRMTWEQNSRTLVMMTQLEERGRVKCVQYWPSRDSVTYHGITITACDVEELAYYSIRSFKLQRGNEVREVKQFQFTAWPDHGVPDHPTPFLMFLRRIKVSNPPDSGPMIVLCSAGVGRTGCFIVIDSMIERIKHENTIDIYGHVTSLRAQRNYIVQTEDQYMFIHDAVLEAIIASGTEVPVSKLGEHLHNMMQVIPSEGITNLELEFKRLASIRYAGQKFISANLPINKHKNRLMNILPYESTRVCLEPIAGVEGSDYINASFCDGYRQRNAYIATQSPLPDTVEDLWRMLIEHNSSIIIMLTKLKEGGREKCTQYWPAERYGDYGPYRISLNQEYDSTLNYILREFTITDSRSPNYSRVVRQFHYFNWPEQGVPKAGHAFINFIAEVHKTKDQFGIEGPITVHCSVGVGRTGVFIALSIVLERLREEGFLDLFETVRTLRTQRPGMVQTEDQYQFCYQTALEYVRSF